MLRGLCLGFFREHPFAEETLFRRFLVLPELVGICLEDAKLVLLLVALAAGESSPDLVCGETALCSSCRRFRVCNDFKQKRANSAASFEGPRGVVWVEPIRLSSMVVNASSALWSNSDAGRMRSFETGATAVVVRIVDPSVALLCVPSSLVCINTSCSSSPGCCRHLYRTKVHSRSCRPLCSTASCSSSSAGRFRRLYNATFSSSSPVSRRQLWSTFNRNLGSMPRRTERFRVGG